MKLKEMLKERERLDKELQKYEAEMQRRKDLKEWKARFGVLTELPMSVFPFQQIVGLSLPSHIREIILNSLQAEIDKIEEE